MQVIIIFGQIILGFFQVAALTAGLELWIGLHWLIALPFLMLYDKLFGGWKKNDKVE